MSKRGGAKDANSEKTLNFDLSLLRVDLIFESRMLYTHIASKESPGRALGQ